MIALETARALPDVADQGGAGGFAAKQMTPCALSRLPPNIPDSYAPVNNSGSNAFYT